MLIPPGHGGSRGFAAVSSGLKQEEISEQELQYRVSYFQGFKSSSIMPGSPRGAARGCRVRSRSEHPPARAFFLHSHLLHVSINTSELDVDLAGELGQRVARAQLRQRLPDHHRQPVPCDVQPPQVRACRGVQGSGPALQNI